MEKTAAYTQVLDEIITIEDVYAGVGAKNVKVVVVEKPSDAINEGVLGPVFYKDGLTIISFTTVAGSNEQLEINDKSNDKAEYRGTIMWPDEGTSLAGSCKLNDRFEKREGQ